MWDLKPSKRSVPTRPGGRNQFGPSARTVVVVGTPTHPAQVAAAAAGLALVHLLAGRLRFGPEPRSLALSAAGGVSVSYVFVHVLPELGDRTGHLAGLTGRLDHHVYLVTLVGFASFYGLELLAQRSEEAETDGSSVGFWLHVGGFVPYYALVGYLLAAGEREGALDLGVFAVAMALHFAVVDHGLREHHRDRYDRLGRWLLAGSVLAGTAVGLAVRIEEAAVTLVFAFLAGGIILNAIKEELPADRRSRFPAFAAGAAGYAALLLFG